MDKIYYAKSVSENGQQETNKAHLTKVSNLAGKFGTVFGQECEAELCGKLHDFGKYSESFQEVLKGTKRNIDHAFCGAVFLYGATKSQHYYPIIEAINGHHDGLVSTRALMPYFCENLKSNHPVCCNAGKESALTGAEEYKQALHAFKNDFPSFKIPPISSALPAQNNVEKMLHTRMLFSCLVDADYTVSAETNHPEYLKNIKPSKPDYKAILKRLYSFQAEIGQNSTANAELNNLRNKLFERCGAAGDLPEGLFTLTAPTGTGKTLALLHFALRHCLSQNKNRIIVVLPFLTLTEQNAAIYSKIIPDVLIDHSQNNLDDTARELSACWNMPFIITTSVKFFESLFAYKPSDCRKLHNIANSVILFDEAQSLPPGITTSTIQAVHTLCGNYRCTMVFSTATQPRFDALPAVSWKPIEIMPDHKVLYQALQRTKLYWRLNTKTPLNKIAAEMAKEISVCAIVNLRRHACVLYKRLKEQCPEEEVFFLTTDLCPAHRSKIINSICMRLKHALPCRVVATQCIEAGVDLDFDVMYRSLAPLDAIIQAAGRCNRNGQISEGGKVIIFEPDEEGNLYPDDWYGNAALLVKTLLSRGTIDIHNPEHISHYYCELFHNARDIRVLTNAIKESDYQETARNYQLIKKHGVCVIVPYQDKLDLFEFVNQQILQNGLTPKLMRESASITISAYDEDSIKCLAQPLFYHTKKYGVRVPSNYYILPLRKKEFYTADMGLQFQKSSPEDFII